MSDEPGKRSSRFFWTTFPGVVTAISGLIVAVTGLITALVALGVFGGGSGSPVAPADRAATAPAAQTLTASAAAAGASAGSSDVLAGRWSNDGGGFLVFERVSALAPGYEFTEYDAGRSVIGGGEGVLEGTTFRIASAHSDFIGGYTGDLVLEGNRLHGAVQPDLGGAAVTIELTRAIDP